LDADIFDENWWDDEATLATSEGGLESKRLEAEALQLGPQGLAPNLRFSLSSRFWVWKAINTKPFVMDWLKPEAEGGGYNIEWADDALRPPPWSGPNNVQQGREWDFANTAILEMLETGALVYCPEAVVCAPVSVCEKNTLDAAGLPKLRLLWDGRYANEFMKKRPFVMGSLKKTARNLFQDDEGFALDLTSAYFHCTVATASRRYLGLIWPIPNAEGVLVPTKLAFAVLPFGARFSAQVFSETLRSPSEFLLGGAKLNEEVMAEMESGSEELQSLAREIRYRLRWDGSTVRHLRYLDDWGFWRRPCKARSEHERLEADLSTATPDSAEARRLVINLFQLLGWRLNWAKSDLAIGHVLELLGFVVDTAKMEFRITKKRQDKILAQCVDLVDRAEKGENIPVREVASAAGRLMSLSLVLGRPVHLYTRSIFRCIESREHRCRETHVCSRRCWRGDVALDVCAIRDIKYFIAVLSEKIPGAPMDPDTFVDLRFQGPELSLSTDASDYACGGVLRGHAAPFYKPLDDAERLEGSMVRELIAILFALRSIPPASAPPGTTIKLQTDALSAWWLLERGGSGNKRGDEICVEIDVLCASRGWRLDPTWTNRDWNQGGDDASKIKDADSYGVAQWVVALARTIGARPTLDLFASPWNRISVNGAPLPFCCPFLSEGSMGNAWDHDWGKVDGGGEVWLFPPQGLIARALRKCARDGAKGVLVAPWISKDVWFSWTAKEAPYMRWRHSLDAKTARGRAVFVPSATVRPNSQPENGGLPRGTFALYGFDFRVHRQLHNTE
jgi:hypothetical protein